MSNIMKVNNICITGEYASPLRNELTLVVKDKQGCFWLVSEKYLLMVCWTWSEFIVFPMRFENLLAKWFTTLSLWIIAS
jgi:hypothetical protein